MDTPGGDSDSMNQIVQDELASPVPVIVYVSPAGARAASAGSVITMGSDLAAMAPATHIGAATPIRRIGQNIGSDLRRKILNDSEKQMQALAQSHGRNAQAAVAIVSKAKEFTDTEALHQNLVEFLAPNLPALLERGRRHHHDVRRQADRPAHRERRGARRTTCPGRFSC